MQQLDRLGSGVSSALLAGTGAHNMPLVVTFCLASLCCQAALLHTLQSADLLVMDVGHGRSTCNINPHSRVGTAVEHDYCEVLLFWLRQDKPMANGTSHDEEPGSPTDAQHHPPLNTDVVWGPLVRLNPGQHCNEPSTALL
jgi:hypothetical protein